MENNLYEVVSSTDNGREKMSYEAFCEKLNESLKEEFSDGYEVGVSNVLKNNNVSLTGITVRQENANVGATLYFKDLYSGYLCCSYESVLARAVAFFRDAENQISSDLTFPSWTEARATIMCKLINAAKNAEFLKTVPWVPFADLAVVFFIDINVSMHREMGMGMVTVSKKIAEMWGVTVSQLMETAISNISRILSPTFMSMGEQLKSAYAEKGIKELPPVNEIPGGMWVLSNYFTRFGATSILCADMRKKIGKTVGGRYYAIPSSIHEWIIVPEYASSAEELVAIINDVNSSIMSEQDILGDHPYLFDEHGNLVK